MQWERFECVVPSSDIEQTMTEYYALLLRDVQTSNS